VNFANYITIQLLSSSAIARWPRNLAEFEYLLMLLSAASHM